MAEQSEFAFLGEEFLTWLWWRNETGSSTYELASSEAVGVTLDDYLLIGGGSDDTEQTLRKGLPTRSAEATAALRSGKRLQRARLIVGTQHEEWSLTLDGTRFAFQSVKLQTEEDGELADDERDLARMQGFLRISGIVDELYEQFLAERLTPGFDEQRLPQLRRWVESR